MTLYEILSLAIGSGGLIGTIILFFKMGSFTGFVTERFNRIDESIKELKIEIKECKSEIKQVSERVTFLEAAVLYSSPIVEAEPSNSRSHAAKQMWVKRKARSIENHSK
jgi:hypothetical protein